MQRPHRAHERVALRLVHQTQFVAISRALDQWHSVALSGTRWHSDALSRTKWNSELVKVHQVSYGSIGASVICPLIACTLMSAPPSTPFISGNERTSSVATNTP